MRLPAALLLLAAVVLAQGEPSSCVLCHGEEKIAHDASVHAAVLSCVDCHGGNPAAQRDEQKAHEAGAGFRGKLPRAGVPELCGSCHADALRMHAYALPTDQLEHYRVSGHGRALFGEGDESAAVCTDCHGTHGVLPARDPRAPTAPANQPATCGRCHADAQAMAPHGLPADGVARFLGSVHGRALVEERLRGAPSCADCHGAHGATPPGVQDIVQVCGHCHESTREHYRTGPHGTSPEMDCATCHEEEARGKGGAAYHGAGCTACHGAHDVRPPGPWLYEGDAPGRCGHCHRDEDAAAAVTRTILDGRRELEEAMRATRDAMRLLKEQGLFLEEEEIYLRESARTLVSVQPLAHGVDRAAIAKHLEDGLKRQDRTREAIDRKGRALRDRKILLLGASVVLLCFAGLLWAKLRAVRRLS